MDKSTTTYLQAIEELSKITEEQSPYSKLSILLMMDSYIKFEVNEFHNGKLELNSIEQETAILLYVIIKASVPNIFSEINFIRDYVIHNEHLEAEDIVMMNLSSALNYLVEEWEVEISNSN